MDFQANGENIIVDCGHSLNLDTVKKDREIFIKILELKKPIRLRANNLNKIDTVGFQLLLCFTIAASEENLEWTWESASDAFIHIARLLGINELIKLPNKNVGENL